MAKMDRTMLEHLHELQHREADVCEAIEWTDREAHTLELELVHELGGVRGCPGAGTRMAIEGRPDRGLPDHELAARTHDAPALQGWDEAKVLWEWFHPRGTRDRG
jgi:hypothetical protein